MDSKVDRQEEEDLEWVSSPLKEQKKFSIIFSKNCIIVNLAARCMHFLIKMMISSKMTISLKGKQTTN